jgi:DNA repair protein RadA/Sms
VAGLIAEGSETHSPGPVLYVSGEESVEQISSRADRLNICSHDLFLFSATDLEVHTTQSLSPSHIICMCDRPEPFWMSCHIESG